MKGVRFIFKPAYPVIHAGRGASFRKAVDVSKLRRITLVQYTPFLYTHLLRVVEPRNYNFLPGKILMERLRSIMAGIVLRSKLIRDGARCLRFLNPLTFIGI